MRTMAGRGSGRARGHDDDGGEGGGGGEDDFMVAFRAAERMREEEEGEGEGAAVSEVEASSAEEVLGTWTLPLESPQGAFNMVLEFSAGTDGMLAALVDTPLGDPQTAQNISRSGDALVLGFTLSALGQSLPVTVTNPDNSPPAQRFSIC